MSLTQVAKTGGCQLRSGITCFKEADEPSMFDDIQAVLFDGTDNVGKAFRVLNGKLRLCLICDEVSTRQGAAEHAATVCRPASQRGSPEGDATE
jgi:hypothetical protein